MHPNAPTTDIVRPRRGRGNPYSRPSSPWRGSRGKPSEGSPGRFFRFLICGGASGGLLSLPPKKAAKETAKGDLFRGGPLWDPSPTTKGAPPPSIPNGGRGTGERGRGRGTVVVGRGTEEKDGGYGLLQPVTSVTGFAMTQFFVECLFYTQEQVGALH